MLCSRIIGNSVSLSATNFRANRRYACAAEWFSPTYRAVRGLRNLSVQQHRHRHVDNEKLAHMAERGSVPLTDETIGQLLGSAARRWPERECAVSHHQGMRLTFSQILRRADRLAAGLMKLGMKRGDPVGLWGPNEIEWMIGFVAAARAGFVTVAINPTYQMDEIVYAVGKVGVKAVISPANFRGARRFSDVETLASSIDVERIAAEQDEISCYSGSNIQFTSGTTGRPKATVLSHKSLVNNSKQAVFRSGLNAEQRVCLNVPLFHAFGIVKGILATLHAGSTLVLQAPSFNPVTSLEAILREKCNVVYGTPTMWINLLDAHRRLQPPPISLSCGVTGGAPASPELFKNIRKTFNFDNMKTIYGLTETTGVIFQTLPDENPELTETTIGHLSNHVEVKIVDAGGKTVPFDVPGELWVRGYCTMVEYFADEENTRKTITEDGWLRTGDKFILRSNGYGQIVGRLKDMLIRGGENIFPKEIEDVLMTHPWVIEAQVIGAYDKVYGEEVCACVRVRQGGGISEDELRVYCKGRMAPFKIPRYIKFVEGFPKTASGKVRKHILKQGMEEQGVIPADNRS